MGKNRINKLIVPLTIRSASILSAFTIMATSMGGCATKKNENSKQTDTSINTSSETETEITNNSNIITSTQEEESTTEKKEEKPATSAPETTAKAPQTANKSDNTTKPPTSDNNNNNNHDEKPPKEDDNKFIPLTTSNINNITVFERAVMEVSRKTRGGFGGIWGYYYEGEIYRSFGLPFDELKYVLVALNKNYLSDDMLNSLLESYSEDELKRYYYVLGPMIGFVENAQCENNWDGLIIDPQTLNEFKAIEKAFLDYRFKNNPEPLKKILYNYNINTSNPLVGYYIYQACDYATRNSSIKADEDVVDKYIGLITNVKSECVSLAENIYSRSHGKKKILE